MLGGCPMSKLLREFIMNKEHHKYRKDYPEYENLAEKFSEEGLCPK